MNRRLKPSAAASFLTPVLCRSKSRMRPISSFLNNCVPTVRRNGVEASAYFGQGNWDANELPRRAGVFDFLPLVEELISKGVLKKLSLSHTRELMIHHQTIERIAESVVNTLERLHSQNPLLWSIPKTEIKSHFDYLEHQELLNEAIKVLKGQKKIRLDAMSIGLEGRGPQLTKAEQQLMQNLVKTIKDAGVAPPNMKQLAETAGKAKSSLPQLLQLGCQNNQLLQVSEDLFFHCETMDAIKEKLKQSMETQGLSMSEIRQVLDTSRKYAVPLCEYLDQVGFTKRDGDLRILAGS